MENTELIALLRAHIAALETELARYVHRYGMSDEARRLLKGPNDTPQVH